MSFSLWHKNPYSPAPPIIWERTKHTSNQPSKDKPAYNQTFQPIRSLLSCGSLQADLIKFVMRPPQPCDMCDYRERCGGGGAETLHLGNTSADTTSVSMVMGRIGGSLATRHERTQQ